jgi:hypothetical protein
MLTMLLLGLGVSDAVAGEVWVRANRPVSVVVGDSAAVLGPTPKAVVRDLDGGTHTVRVQSLLGRTLYEGTIEVPDDGVVDASWVGDRLTVVPRPGYASDAAEVEEAVVVDEPVVDEVVEEVPAAPPVVAAPPPVAPAPLAIPVAPAPVAAAPVAPPEPPAPVLSSVAVGAGVDGLKLTIELGGSVVHLQVVDGTLTLTDDRGTNLSVPVGAPVVAAAPAPPVVAVAPAPPPPPAPPPAPPVDATRPGLVTINGAPSDGALVVVDGVTIAAVPAGATSVTLAIDDGAHVLEVRGLADERLLHVGRLDVAAGQRTTVTVPAS